MLVETKNTAFTQIAYRVITSLQLLHISCDQNVSNFKKHSNHTLLGGLLHGLSWEASKEEKIQLS